MDVTLPGGGALGNYQMRRRSQGAADAARAEAAGRRR